MSEATVMTFEEWRGIVASQRGCQDCIYDGARLIDHCHNCCLAIIGDAWRHFQGQPRANRSQDAKVTDGEATLTLGPVAGVFAEATGDATAESVETYSQRVKASHLCVRCSRAKLNPGGSPWCCSSCARATGFHDTECTSLNSQSPLKSMRDLGWFGDNPRLDRMRVEAFFFVRDWMDEAENGEWAGEQRSRDLKELVWKIYAEVQEADSERQGQHKANDQ